jgi:hypothetical protein
MLNLQELKNDLSDAALGEASGMKLHKLNVREIKRVCFQRLSLRK